MFTPELREFYNEVNKDGNVFEVVFFSLDRSEDEAKAYLEEAHGNWLWLKPDEKIVEELSDHFKVEGIPALIILKPNGDVITSEGRAELSVSSFLA